MKRKYKSTLLNKKYYLPFFLIVLFSIACHSSKTVIKTSQKVEKYFRISGKVEQRSNYCGGARPTAEILARFAIPKPFPAKTFYIKEGNSNTLKAKLITSFTTKEDGSFSFQLPKGIYSIIVAEQLHPISAKDLENKNQKVDEQCLQKWWKTPYSIIEVKDLNNSPLYFLFEHQCRIKQDIPCITYIGPLPQ